MEDTFVSSRRSDFQLEVKTLLSLCESLDTPRSLTVYLMIKHGEWQQYVDLKIDHDSYDNPSNFADDYLVTVCLQKSPNLPLEVDRREAALSSFWDSELACWFTNQRIRETTFDFEHVFRRRLADILGPLTSGVLREISESFRHGPGATATLKSLGLVPSDKYDEQLSLTVSLIPFYKSVVGDQWRKLQESPKIVVDGNKFTTVPKNAKTDRGICAEPTLNMYVQLGIGKYIRKRLRKFGIDLDDQSRNQKMASRAFAEGLATIDLSAASDSLASQVVLSYLPDPWAELLCLCRSHRCQIDGEWHELEKFSSMGNGYTFELESLIFYALCLAVIPKGERGRIGVYGDDIIVPSTHSSAIIDALNYLGFRVNRSKSFLAGNFFESCGADFWRGVPVRPFYLKGNSGRTPYALRLANRIRSYSRMRLGYFGCDSRFRKTWLELYTTLPHSWRKCKVPEQFGDLGVVCSRREAKPQTASKCPDFAGHEGWIVRIMAFKPVYSRKNTQGVLLSALSAIGATEEPTRGREPKRGYLGKPRPKRSVTSYWPDGFSWFP